jgi:hypothetical protein
MTVPAAQGGLPQGGNVRHRYKVLIDGHTEFTVERQNRDPEALHDDLRRKPWVHLPAGRSVRVHWDRVATVDIRELPATASALIPGQRS